MRTHVRIGAGRVVAAVLLGALMTMASEAGEPLGDYQWRNRLLLVFAPRPDDPRARDTLRSVQQLRCEMQDRDLLTGVLIENGVARIGERPLSRADARALRGRLRVDPQDFVVILIGKDGGEKSRVSTAPSLADVFSLIDGMPMRRREMRERGETLTANALNECRSPRPASRRSPG